MKKTASGKTVDLLLYPHSEGMRGLRQKQTSFIRLWVILLLAVCCPWIARSEDRDATPQRPALREQMSLNGDWTEGGKVPQYFGERLERKTYRRTVHVPKDWAGKRVELAFRQLNYSAEVFIDNQLAGSHVGGWVPFSLDLTGQVKPGSDFDLRVELKSSTLPPYVDEHKHPLWPVGTYNLDGSFAGIIDDVWLRAYGEVAIHDAFIKTSVRNHSIEVDYTVINHGATPRHVRIQAQAGSANDGKTERTFSSDVVEIKSGQTNTISLHASWPEAKLWWPDQPHLYLLQSRLIESDREMDRETRRFGFREIWISTNQYVLNGIRVNLWGDSIPRSWTDKTRITPEAWPAMVDFLMRDLNMRIIRWHQFPPSDYLLDVADEKGLMIIEESALYARPWTQTNQQAVIDNMRRTWIPEWIPAHRNHPSIVLWSAENEDYKCVGGFSPAQLQSLSDTIAATDPTRPVIHDGDEDLDGLARTFNWHYPENYEQLPKGSIYSWANKVHPSKPTGIGEFLACPWVEKMKPQVFWWHGTWSRGLRYVNFTDIRPFVMTWAWDNKQPEARENLRNSFSPVALFDLAYDDLGIEPLMTRNYPPLQSGSPVERRLALYNDEFRGTNLTVDVQLASGGKTRARVTKDYTVGLGQHSDIPVTLNVPAATDPLELILSVLKDGKLRFSETKKFQVLPGTAVSDKTASIQLGEAK